VQRGELTGVELPGRDDAATLRRIRRALPDAAETAPPPEVERAIAAIRRLLAGEPEDLADVVVDLDDVPDFHRRVYDVARTIPPGETRSYGDIARALGEPGAAQAVGRALGGNPVPIVVPCHRVLAADGSLHGFSAPGGIDTKRRMLEVEGALAPALFS
jgi:methylated-DNA-[protein]-cysteine S-methyltransferase